MINESKPNFVEIKGKEYYFDILNNTIFGPKYGTFGYWHELAHFNDNKNESYRKMSLAAHSSVQFVSMLSILMMIFSFFFRTYDVMSLSFIFQVTGFLILPYALFSFQEEIRADIYGIVMVLRNKR